MKSRDQKKRRSQTIVLDAGTIDLDRLRKEGRIGVPVSVILERSYARHKGPKVITHVPHSGKEKPLHPNETLLAFDHLFAVDTNTRTIGQETISVTCIVHCKMPKDAKPPGPVTIQFRPIEAVEYRGINEDQERVGWCELIDQIKLVPALQDKRIGLIVDAHLSLLTSINRGEVPLLGDKYLPKNMSLIYASSDIANESLANKMLSLADKTASELLDHVIKAPPDDLVAVTGKPYSHRRSWRKNNSQRTSNT
jgi:hypothetical protein